LEAVQLRFDFVVGSRELYLPERSLTGSSFAGFCATRQGPLVRGVVGSRLLVRGSLCQEFHACLACQVEHECALSQRVARFVDANTFFEVHRHPLPGGRLRFEPAPNDHPLRTIRPGSLNDLALAPKQVHRFAILLP